MAGGRRGTATGNVLVVLSMLALGAALVYPILAQRQADERMADVIGRVEAVRQAAARYHDNQQDLPPNGGVGVAPQGLSTLLTPDFSFAGEGFALEWRLWDRAEEAEEVSIPDPVVPVEEELITAADTAVAPPRTVRSFGSLSVHSGEPFLLSGLLSRYGETSSFVRDTTWTLLIPLFSRPRAGGNSNE